MNAADDANARPAAVRSADVCKHDKQVVAYDSAESRYYHFCGTCAKFLRWIEPPAALLLDQGENQNIRIVSCTPMTRKAFGRRRSLAIDSRFAVGPHGPAVMGVKDGRVPSLQQAISEVKALESENHSLTNRVALQGEEIMGWKKLVNDVERLLGFKSFATDPSARSVLERVDDIVRHIGPVGESGRIKAANRWDLVEQIRLLTGALVELVGAASEQQHTIQSLGWESADKRDNDWSKAGARRHQHERIDVAIAKAQDALQGGSE